MNVCVYVPLQVRYYRAVLHACTYLCFFAWLCKLMVRADPITLLQHDMRSKSGIVAERVCF